MAEYRKPTWFEAVPAPVTTGLPEPYQQLVKQATAEAIGFGLVPKRTFDVDLRAARPERGEAPGVIVEVVIHCEDTPEPVPLQAEAFTTEEIVAEVATMTPQACAGVHSFTPADSERMRSFEHESATCLNCGTDVTALELAASVGLVWRDGRWQPGG